MKIKIFILFVLFFMIECLNSQIPTIFADKKEITGDILKAYGHVEVIWKEYRFYADYIELNLKENTLIAEGRVTISSAETVVSGDKLKFNTKDMTGEMVDTQGVMQPSIRYKMDHWKHVDKDTQKFKNMDFTSCSQCVPRWIISCKNGKIKKDKYIEMKNVVFKIKKIPVLYLPWLRYPIQKDGRSTGFLFPVITPFSERLGFTLKNAFFWDIRPNVDLTLYFDYYKKAGIGIAEEFRYLFRRMRGNLKYLYFKHVLDSPVEENNGDIDKKVNILGTTKEFDYILKMNHIQNIHFFKTEIKVKIDRQSDPGLLRLHQKNFESQRIRSYFSEVNLTSYLSKIRFNLNLSERDTFYTIQNTSSTIRYLPSVTMSLNQQRVWKLPGYFSFNTSFQRMERTGKRYEVNEAEPIYTQEIKTHRINIIPSYKLNFIKLPWFDATLNLRSKHSFYPKSKDPKTGYPVNEPLHLGYQTALFTLDGPVFNRIFNLKNSKIRHTIKPQIKFRYATKVKEEDRNRLISVDRFDHPSYSYVGFGLNTTLYKKEKYKDGFPREVLTYTISQNYFFDEDVANYYRKINDKYPKFSELENALTLMPFKDFSLTAKLSYNHYINKFSKVNIHMDYRKLGSFLKGSISYNSYLNPFNTNPEYFRNQKFIRGYLDFNLPRFPIKIRSGIDYDFSEKRVKYGSVIASIDYQCVTFDFKFRMYTYKGEIFPEFTVGFNMGNLGMVKDFLDFDR